MSKPVPEPAMPQSTTPEPSVADPTPEPIAEPESKIIQLSPHFSLDEFLESEKTKSNPTLLAAQQNPPETALTNLSYLCHTVLEPLRTKLNVPMTVSSGYTSPELNTLIGGTKDSQHILGEAADIILHDSFLSDPNTANIREEINTFVLQMTNKNIRSDANANFYLFAHICCHLVDFDIDQVIHEMGSGFAQPAWIHVSASEQQSKREILVQGSYTNNPTKHYNLLEALNLGV